MKISNKVILLLGLVLLASAFVESGRRRPGRQGSGREGRRGGQGSPGKGKQKDREQEGDKPDGEKSERGKPEGQRSKPLMCQTEAKIEDSSRLRCCRVCADTEETTTDGKKYACKQIRMRGPEDRKNGKDNAKATKEELEAKKLFWQTLKEKKCCEKPKEEEQPITCSLEGENTPTLIKCDGQPGEVSLKCYPFGKMGWSKKPRTGGRRGGGKEEGQAEGKPARTGGRRKP